MTSHRRALLTQLLQPLVREWGKEAIFSELSSFPIDESFDEFGKDHFVQKPRSNAKRPSAVQLAKKIDQFNHRRELLMMIATKYDEKNFLPSVSDVREFLAMRGKGRRPIKDRSEGFRLFLELANELSLEQLQHLATSRAFSGPSELGPLSDAINASGQERRQNSTLIDAELDAHSVPDVVDVPEKKADGSD